MVLAGDIGGTNTRLAFFQVESQRLHLVSEAVFPSHNYQNLQQIISEFASSQNYRAEAACFGIAGPVNKGVVQTPNLPWTVVAAAIADEIGLPSVQLLNDLEANAHGVALLSIGDTICIHAGSPEPTGNRAVISAGTGLGEAGLFWNGQKHLVFASEGGHGDFAPRNDLELELLRHNLHLAAVDDLRFRDVAQTHSKDELSAGDGVFDVERDGVGCPARDRGSRRLRRVRGEG